MKTVGSQTDGGATKDGAQAHADGAVAKDGSIDSGKAPHDAGTDGPVPIADASMDAPRCPATCSRTRPHCDHTTDYECVECATHAHCADPTPQCDPGGHSCVACTSNTACKDRTNTKVCDTGSASATKGQCVECMRKADCTGGEVCSATHQCVQCTQDMDCPATKPQCNTSTNLCEKCKADATGDSACSWRTAAGKTICDRSNDATYGGTCVQCTGKRYTTCNTGTDYVCDSLARTCTTDKKVGTALACDPCVSDAQCGTGLACVEQMFGSSTVGRFCFYEKTTNGGCADTVTAVRPYSQTKSLTSIDSTTTQDFCLPVTTCQAYLDATGQGASGGKDCANTGVADDTKCGLQNIDDGHCGTSTKQCTYACIYAYDCPGSGFTSCSGTPPSTPGYCN